VCHYIRILHTNLDLAVGLCVLLDQGRHLVGHHDLAERVEISQEIVGRHCSRHKRVSSQLILVHQLQAVVAVSKCNADGDMLLVRSIVALAAVWCTIPTDRFGDCDQKVVCLLVHWREGLEECTVFATQPNRSMLVVGFEF
jgi:hypothetical protein